MELVYTGGQPEGQRAGEEQTPMPPLTGTTMGHKDLETGSALEVEDGGTANGVGHLLPLGPKRLTF